MVMGDARRALADSVKSAWKKLANLHVLAGEPPAGGIHNSVERWITIARNACTQASLAPRPEDHARLWRLRDPSVRAIVRRRFDFLFAADGR